MKITVFKFFQLASLSLTLLLSLPANSANFVDADEQSLNELKEIISRYSDLYDPFSAQFRRTQVFKWGDGNGFQKQRWCGQINAKNLAGAYAGWKYFAVISIKPEDASFLIEKDHELPIIRYGFIEGYCSGSLIGPDVKVKF